MREREREGGRERWRASRTMLLISSLMSFSVGWVADFFLICVCFYFGEETPARSSRKGKKKRVLSFSLRKEKRSPFGSLSFSFSLSKLLLFFPSSSSSSSSNFFPTTARQRERERERELLGFSPSCSSLSSLSLFPIIKRGEKCRRREKRREKLVAEEPPGCSRRRLLRLKPPPKAGR